MKSDAQRGSRKSVGVVIAVLAVLCLFSVFAIREIHTRSVSAKSDVWIEQSESAEQLAADLAVRVDMTDLVQLNGTQIEKYYAVPKETLEKAVVYTDTTESELHEIAVFQVSSPAERDMVMNAVNTRISAFSTTYNLSNSASSEKMYFVGNSGPYVVFVIGVPYARASAAVLSE